jgi:aminomethyltransferase
MNERGIPRNGYEVFVDAKKVGVVTSGSQSPKLKYGIGLAYIDKTFSKVGQEIKIEIRNKLLLAEIIKPPFICDTSLNH